VVTISKPLGLDLEEDEQGNVWLLVDFALWCTTDCAYAFTFYYLKVYVARVNKGGNAAETGSVFEGDILV
jgi:hypothetical protein